MRVTQPLESRTCEQYGLGRPSGLRSLVKEGKTKRKKVFPIWNSSGKHLFVRYDMVFPKLAAGRNDEASWSFWPDGNDFLSEKSGYFLICLWGGGALWESPRSSHLPIFRSFSRSKGRNNRQKFFYNFFDEIVFPNFQFLILGYSAAKKGKQVTLVMLDLRTHFYCTHPSFPRWKGAWNFQSIDIQHDNFRPNTRRKAQHQHIFFRKPN